MELHEGYNGVIDPKELYAKYGKQEPKNKKEVDETIKETKIVEEQIDEIEDEVYEEYEYTTYNFTEHDKEEIRMYQPIFESEEESREYNSPYYFQPEVPTIKVNYHKDRWPWLVEMEKIDKGDFIDLRAAEEYELKQGEFKLINLGISVQLPKGYHAEVVPRSSTYKNFGIIMSNSIGIIDESYCGDNDIWRFPAIAMRDTTIHTNDRICQFRIVKNRDIKIEVVDELENEDRGGIGSTGKK